MMIFSSVARRFDDSTRALFRPREDPPATPLCPRLGRVRCTPESRDANEGLAASGNRNSSNERGERVFYRLQRHRRLHVHLAVDPDQVARVLRVQRRARRFHVTHVRVLHVRAVGFDLIEQTDRLEHPALSNGDDVEFAVVELRARGKLEISPAAPRVLREHHHVIVVRPVSLAAALPRGRRRVAAAGAVVARGYLREVRLPFRDMIKPRDVVSDRPHPPHLLRGLRGVARHPPRHAVHAVRAPARVRHLDDVHRAFDAPADGVERILHVAVPEIPREVVPGADGEDEDRASVARGPREHPAHALSQAAVAAHDADGVDAAQRRVAHELLAVARALRDDFDQRDVLKQRARADVVHLPLAFPLFALDAVQDEEDRLDLLRARVRARVRVRVRAADGVPQARRLRVERDGAIGFARAKRGDAADVVERVHLLLLFLLRADAASHAHGNGGRREREFEHATASGRGEGRRTLFVPRSQRRRARGGASTRARVDGRARALPSRERAADTSDTMRLARGNPRR
eukprot:14302-Pelagococcus_subviridis.AAC.2